MWRSTKEKNVMSSFESILGDLKQPATIINANRYKANATGKSLLTL